MFFDDKFSEFYLFIDEAIDKGPILIRVAEELVLFLFDHIIESWISKIVLVVFKNIEFVQFLLLN